MASGETAHLATDQAEGPEGKGDHTTLVDDIMIAVESRGAIGLGPHNEEESEVVDPGVCCDEHIVAELRGEGDRDEHGHDHDDSDDNGARPPLSPVGVDDAGDHGFQHGESRGHAEQEKRREEDDGEEISARHLSKSLGIRQEGGGKTVQQTVGLGGQTEVSDDAEDGKGGRRLDEHVGDANDDGVLHGIAVLGVVAGVRGVVSHTDTGGEEDLATGLLPEGGGRKLRGVPVAHVHAHAIDGVGQRGAAADEDDDEGQGNAHGEVNDAAGQANATEDAEPHDDPSEDGPAEGFTVDSHTRVGGVADDAAVVANDSGDGIHLLEDEVVVELLRTTLPRQRAVEGVAEELHDPRDHGNKVDGNGITVIDDTETNTLGTLVRGVPRDDTASAEGLSDGDLEHEGGDGEEEEREQVGHEELQPVVVVDDGGVTEETAKTNSATHGGENERAAAAPSIAPISGLCCWGGELVQAFAEEVLHRGRRRLSRR